MINLMQEYSEWKQGYINLLMIKDDYTSPGYCLLQVIIPDQPLPSKDVTTKNHVKVDKKIVLFKNSLETDLDGRVRHGPAWTTQRPGLRIYDIVLMSFKCNSWPKEARQWLQEGSNMSRPSEEIKKFAQNSGCFVVPVASSVSQYKDLEWRISTSLAERSLMFSLNITQIRYYVLVKMALKTYLNIQGESNLSSFMCKAVLMNCVKKTHPGFWVESNILTCFTYYLQRILFSIIHDHCPHFIIPENNLMAGQFSAQIKHVLLQKLRFILQDIRQALFGIEHDDLGKRLQVKLNMTPQNVYAIKSASNISLIISEGILDTVSNVLHTCYEQFAKRLPVIGPEAVQLRIVRFLQIYRCLYRNGGMFEQTAISLLAPFMCSTLGSVIAASCIQKRNCLSREATDWLNLGLNSDVSSGRLKLASVLYCSGDTVRAEHLLKEMERYNWEAVEPICSCYVFKKKSWRDMYLEACDCKEMSQAIRQNTSFCVRFLRSEINCIPHELQYDMFRSTSEDLLYRNQSMDVWMDWAVVDSLPYLYFLQYKVYERLQRRNDKEEALLKLVTVFETPALNLCHWETAFNLLGQCMEKEHLLEYALLCYMRSLQLRTRNNVAKMHICRLLSNLVNQHGI